MARVRGLQCRRCGALHDPRAALPAGCPICSDDRGAAAVTPVYDDLPTAQRVRQLAGESLRSMWRYQALLPVTSSPVTLGEGGTPLLPLPTLGGRWGLTDLYVKDEGRNPTGSWKDRMFSVALTRARDAGVRVVALASSGNAGASAAAYASRAGIRCVVFTTASAPRPLQQQMQALDAALIATRAPAERWTLLRAGVEQLGWHALTNFVTPPVGSNPYGVEGYKTIAFEIVEALGWRAPDWIVVPTCYGDGLWGIMKGFDDLRKVGVLAEIPRPVAAEVFGPLAAALNAGADTVAPVPAGPSVAFSIAAGISTYQALHALRAFGGRAAVVRDEELLEVGAELGASEGLFAEPSAVAGLAAARSLRRAGVVRQDDCVVAVVSATGLKDPGAGPRTSVPAPVIDADPRAMIRVLAKRYHMTIEGGAA